MCIIPINGIMVKFLFFLVPVSEYWLMLQSALGLRKNARARRVRHGLRLDAGESRGSLTGSTNKARQFVPFAKPTAGL
jgi:hypothetical protein